MNNTATKHQRRVSMPAPNLLQIVTGDVMREYRIEVWVSGPGLHLIDLTRMNTGGTYTITVKGHRNPHCSEWRCDCPASKHRGGQCKHVLAIKAGLRSVGVRV